MKNKSNNSQKGLIEHLEQTNRQITKLDNLLQLYPNTTDAQQTKRKLIQKRRELEFLIKPKPKTEQIP
jgi:ferritin-like metal-binding protein YciE